MFRVIGEPLEKLINGQRPIIGMPAGAIEGGGRHFLQQFVILAPQPAQCFEGLLRLPARVVQVLGPALLVEGHDGRVILGEHLAETAGKNEFRVRQVRYELPDAPFTGSRSKIFFFSEHTGEYNGEHLRPTAVSFQESGDFGHMESVSNNPRSSCSIRTGGRAICTSGFPTESSTPGSTTSARPPLCASEAVRIHSRFPHYTLTAELIP